MSNSIINPSTLTEEQKDALDNLYQEAREDARADNELSQLVSYSRITLLELIFGKTIFEK